MKQFVQFIKDFIFLFFYYRMKKKGFVADLYISSWNSLYMKDIGRYKALLRLDNGMVVNVCLVNIDKPGYIPEGIYFDIEYLDGMPYIRDCNFRTFYKIYKELILHVADNDDEEVVRYGY